MICRAIAIFALTLTSVVASPQRQAPVRAMPISTPAASVSEKEDLQPAPKSTPQGVVALPNYDEETSTRLQIFLDNSDFGPGKIDGRMGEFFRKALVSFKHSRAQLETGVIDQWMLDQVPQTFTSYTIPPEAETVGGATSNKPSEQAKLKRLNY